MLARVAENLYWLGRYLERAENMSRLVDVTRLAISEHAVESDPWASVLETLGAEESFAEASAVDESLTAERFVLDAPESEASIVSTVRKARTLAVELREHTSREVFEEINRMYLGLVGRSPTAGGRADITREIRRSVATIYGLFENTVLQTEGTNWFRLGQMFERADMTSRIVDAKYFIALPSTEDVGGTFDRYQWRGILLSASALEAYRKSLRRPIRLDYVLDLLFFNADFPRSLLFCVNEIAAEFSDATRHAPPNSTLAAARELSMLRLELGALNGSTVVERGLHEFIDDFQSRLGRIDTALRDNLFNATPGGGERTRPMSRVSATSSLQGSDSVAPFRAGEE